MSWEMETSGATGDPQKPVYVFARQLVVKDLYQLLCWGGVKEGGGDGKQNLWLGTEKTEWSSPT